MTTLADKDQTHNAGRRRFIRTTAGGMVLAASMPGLIACSASAPDSATAAWRNEISDESIVRWGLSYGILAPNPHNLQPWLVDISRPGEMLLSIDANRLLPETDPFSRQIMIGTGAMLGVFELALATKGYAVQSKWIAETAADQLTPLDTSKPLLHITVSKDPELSITSNEQALFDQIRNRRTVRGIYDSARSPDKTAISALTELATPDQSIGVLERNANATQFDTIAELVKTAWHIEMATPDTNLESMRLLRIGSKEINKHRDGIAIESTFLLAMSKLGILNRNKPLKPGSSGFKRQITDFNDAIDSTPAWLYLTSDDNTRISQIDVGRTYVMAQLKAAHFGLVMHPTSQGLQEYDEMKDVAASISSLFGQITTRTGQTVQMLTRIGYLPAESEAPKPAPRRGLNAHIISS